MCGLLSNPLTKDCTHGFYRPTSQILIPLSCSSYVEANEPGNEFLPIFTSQNCLKGTHHFPLDLRPEREFACNTTWSRRTDQKEFKEALSRRRRYMYLVNFELTST